MHKILIPVDGSIHAMKALKVASDLATKYQGRLYILHILLRGKDASDLMELDISSQFDQHLQKLMNTAIVADLGPAPDKVLQRVGQIILDHFAERAAKQGAAFEVLPITSGSPADEILKTQQKIEAGTIVMGARGVTQSDLATFGSVSQEVFNRAQCTCISVK
ncbi:MAG: universal stress protein [Roseibium sp.]|uniref:universal stress protein n=1 Tax=Roseibium sp. TaxID=1936156 RepID=UPI001B2B60C8|nr:universal stress protein [Roseibium sp.]MBO6512289.1 universal stress protein [Roseibium sp.]MBO6891039.1 universal stress protein [Roseibium sp.]MBO6932854.1 universal stress protein [Roseibium sp.]